MPLDVASDPGFTLHASKDVARQLTDHRQTQGKGAKYLRGKGPLRLVFEKKIGAPRTT